MKIYKYEVDNELILKYCRVIMLMKDVYNKHLEEARTEFHNEIFNSVGRHRALPTRDDRKFNTALNIVVSEMCDIT